MTNKRIIIFYLTYLNSPPPALTKEPNEHLGTFSNYPGVTRDSHLASMGYCFEYLVDSKQNLPTLTGACSRVFSTLLLLAGAETLGPAGLLGNTTPTPNEVLPRSPDLGGALGPWAGVELPGLVVVAVVVAAERAREFVLATERLVGGARLDGGVPAALPLDRRRRWMAGGSCFIGLSCTQKVWRLMGLRALAG